MDEIARLLEVLEDFKRTRNEYIELKKIEDFMIGKLKAIRLDTIKGAGKKKRSGSIITYFHPILRLYEGSNGHFTLHIIHKGKDRIRTINFKNILYQILRKIIFYMAQERKKS